MRTAYRAEKFTELCEVCRQPTGYRCFHCQVPLCTEHAHLSCVSCNRAATEVCKRCGRGICDKHQPKSKRHRCSKCEGELWELAGRVSATGAPATARDAAMVGGLFAASMWSAALAIPALAVGLAVGAFGWPAGKMVHIARKRRAKAEQLRPDFIARKTHHPRLACWTAKKR
ncbi:MAG: hypothetical protein KJO07_16325 [Deltaproteobacteria bacterium]|nr:hypothetical protein [Deltaproteobacteria bacterium]